MGSLSPKSVNVRNRVFEVIAAVLLVRHRDEPLLIDSNLREMGIDSIDALSIVFELEKEFKVSIKDEDVMAIVTPRNAIEALEKALTEKQ